MPIPIPAYLLALAAGELEGVKIGPRSTVWAEPSLVQRAAGEFSETEDFLRVAEEVAGPYRWGVYDLLVLPPSFPYGGMENPCLTFLSPSLIAGDKSLADVVAHEIAHSWSGNLVTNADWSSFWLNEGFTMFLERRVTGRLRGQPYRHFDACLGLTELRRDVMKHFGPQHPATALAPVLGDLDPDDAFSRVPYEKGHTFLFYLESIVNEGLDGDDYGPFGDYLKSYFSRWAERSLSVAEWKEDFLAWFRAKHPLIHKRLVERVDFDTWLFKCGMPPVIPDYDRSLCGKCQCLASL
jgi:leukotriene-A4 hydrolase